MSEAVLCDFDGVIRLWSEEDIAPIESECGLPAGTILGAAFRPELLRAATTGVISDEEWRATIAESLAGEYGDRARTAVAAWSDLNGEVDHEMLELLRRVRKVVPLVLVTNATTRLDRDLRALGLFDAFDAVANSSALGVVKPEPQIFHCAAALVGVPLSACVFIDDQQGHLDATRDAGASVIHHQSVGSTRDALAAAGISVAAHSTT